MPARCTTGFTDPDYCNNRCPTDEAARLGARPLPVASSAAALSHAPVVCQQSSDSAAWRGHWEVGAEAHIVQWSAGDCQLIRPTASAYRDCLRGQRLIFIGDCMMRYQYLSLVHFLELGAWGPRLVDPQRLEGRDSSDLPRSIASGFSLARHPRSGKTDYANFYRISNMMLQGNERCDCGMGDRRKGVFGRYENRYYHNIALNISVSFFFVKGRSTVHGTDHYFNRKHSWRFRNVAAFIRAQVKPRRPSILVMNIGFWWFRKDYERMALNSTWWQEVLDAAEDALAGSRGKYLLRTTTVPALWRRRDNDGVDQELIRSNAVDKVVLDLVRRRNTRPQGVAFGVLDTYAMTKSFPFDHCNVRDSNGDLVKFFSDDMHAQPFVYQEMNTVLFNMLCAH